MGLIEPDHDCSLCPRLVSYREQLRQQHPQGWFNAPVPAFGPLDARLLIVGLAQGRAGANRTGRPFTGDIAGRVLYPALTKLGFVRGTYRSSADDGPTLIDVRITNAVRCVPPANRPLAGEVRRCSQFLQSEIAAMPGLKVILGLGRIAHTATCRSLALAPPIPKFCHGSFFAVGSDRLLADSYHCSPQNIATGKLSADQFERLLSKVKHRLG
jgi:uracil-DNA glycosylase family 4